MNRIDIQIKVLRVDYEKLSGDRMGETSEPIRKRVQTARIIQQLRFANYQSVIVSNVNIRVREIRQFCRLQDEGQSLMRVAMSQLNLSAHACHRARSVKLTRTMADLAGCEVIEFANLAKRLQYGPRLMVGYSDRIFRRQGEGYGSF